MFGFFALKYINGGLKTYLKDLSGAISYQESIDTLLFEISGGGSALQPAQQAC